jgi:quinone-modifying oxidoreductase subunit QmoC
VEAAEESPQETPETQAPRSPGKAPVPPENGGPVRLEPDLDFIRALRKHGGYDYKKCMQCGTCSATCDLSPDHEPFPRKELAWAAWGMKDRLLRDPDVWLCHQCNDCSTRCPRSARPGNILAAVRRESVLHYAFPRFLGRWVNEPQWLPLLLAIPIALLTLALVWKDPIEKALGISRQAGERILYNYSSVFPHWMLNTFFGFFTLLVLVAILVGVARFWRAMQAAVPADRIAETGRGVVASILTTVKKVFIHDDFVQCTRASPRFLSHLCVFFGFLALTLVTLWVITARYNPVIQGEFIYPFAFLNPWKMLANLGGVALIAGLLLMMRDRLRDREDLGMGSYFDWALISKLFLVVITGFITEVLHYLRLEPHRHIAYFAHLVFVFAVLMYLPYSKLAHLAYRATAMVFAEHTGRHVAAAPSPANPGQAREQEGKDDAGNTTAAP